MQEVRFNFNFLSLVIASVIVASCQGKVAPVPSHQKLTVAEEAITEQTRTEKEQAEREALIAKYIEKQKASSELDPHDALFPTAFSHYEKAKATTAYPKWFDTLGTSNLEGIKWLEKALEVNPYYHAVHWLLGQSYIQIQEYQKAETTLLESIRLKPKFKQGYVSLGKLYRETERHLEALEAFNKATEVGGSSTTINYNMARSYAALNDPAKAEEYYKRVIEAFQNDYATQQSAEQLANIYLRKGDLKVSWEYLRKSEPFSSEVDLPQRIALYQPYLKTNNFYAWASVGLIYYHSLQNEKAIQYLAKAVELSPTKFTQYYELAMAYYNERYYQKAITNLEKAVTLDSTHYDANLQLGILYASKLLSQYDKEPSEIKPNYARAIELLETAKAISPERYDAYYHLGRVYYNTGMYDNALIETQKAAEITQVPAAFSMLGDIYFALENYRSAIEAYKSSLGQWDFGSKRAKIADAYVKLEEYPQAIAFLEEALVLDGFRGNTLLLNKLGDVYQAQGDYDMAIKSYERTLAVEPDDYSATFGVAGCYFSKEKWDSAEVWYRRAAKLNEKDHAPVFNLGLVYLNKQSYSQALDFFNNSLTIEPDDTRTKAMLELCRGIVERSALPDKLEALSSRQDDVGLLSRLLQVLQAYNKANNLWIEGVDESTYEDGRNVVSSKIYEAQGHFEKVQSDLKKLGGAEGKLKEAMDLFTFAVDERIKGIELHSKGFYKTKGEYAGEYEKGRAKMKVADSYLVDGLRIIDGILPKYKSHFGEAALREVGESIGYYEN